MMQFLIPTFPSDVQYQYGYESGLILKKIHTYPAPIDQEDWENRFNRKVDIKIKQYLNCTIHFDKDSLMIDFLESHRFLFAHRPQTFQHGDYHIGNMMIENGQLVIIDFDRFDFGDPWEEFNRIVFCAKSVPEFACGQLDGYFNGTPPLEFFQLLMYYVVLNTISSIPWAMQFGQKEIDTMLENANEVLDWYENLNNPIPKWYKKRLA